MTHARALYEFGDFALDVGQQRLLRRDTGEVIPLTSKVFDTLVYLVEHAGETLAKEVLLQSIWPGVIVEENSLTQNISTLRQVLGEARGENRYIATISRKGYRFVARVIRRDELAAPDVAEASGTPPPAAVPSAVGRRIGLVLASLGILIIVIPTIALFFIPLGPRQPAGVARQNVDAPSIKPLLPPGTQHTQDPEASAFYASGRFVWTQQTEPSLLQAIIFFEQAIARDPNFALAYSGLADSYAVLGVFGMRAPREVFPQARRAAEKALSIDPDLAAAHSALGHIKVQYEHDWEGAAREYARAVQLDPSLALTYHRRALLFAMQGDIDRALAESGRAQQIEPLWLAARAAASQFLYYARRYDESMRIAEQVLALDERTPNARSFLIRNLIVKGNYERALKEIGAIGKQTIQAPGSNAHRAQALALSGQRAAALAELDRILALSRQRYIAAYDIALIYAALADTENTFLWLERAVQDRSTLVNFLAQEPMFDALRADPRFTELVQRIGIYRRTLPAWPGS